MIDIQQKLLATFQIEHRDHVEQIRTLLAVAGQPDSTPPRPDLEEVFRRAHSLKGAARAVDLRPVEELAHRLETLFSRVLQGACSLDKDVSRVVHQVLDASEDCLAAPASSQSGGSSGGTVGAALRAIEVLLGMAESAPAPSPPLPAAEPVPAIQSVDTVRISAGNFDGLFRTAGTLVTESERRDGIAEQLDQLSRAIAELERESEQARRVAQALAGADSGREISQLSTLLGSIGQRARSASKTARAARLRHRHRSRNLSQLGKQLRNDVREARLVPAESLLEGYRRMVRQLARDQNKEIEFDAVCASVQADRRVLDALKDPIMHLLRNAVSHGIESPADRAAKGKKATGVLRLRIDADGQRLTVRIEDDGRGIDFDRVASVATRAGLLSASPDTPRSVAELTRILFRPGFSTAESVTSISGRGMGLSVVYEAIRRLQGEIDLQPLPGGGTAIALSAPLSVASLRLIIVASNRQLFALPVLGVERLLRIDRTSIQTVQGKPSIQTNGLPVPLSTIQALLGLDRSPSGNDREKLQVVVLRSGGQRVALAVDSVLGEADGVIQDLGAAAGCGGRINSGVLLDDGAIAFVVNPMQLVEGALLEGGMPGHANVSFAEPAAPIAEKPPSSILVVDDSMTTRTLEKSILEAHGFRVRIAVDGVDALDHLRREIPDLVISDIEMPRLNGFGLIEAMKKDAELSKIPVIIVSSVERREDQERGLSLGADAYVVKRKFDQEELLTVIRQIL